MYDYVIGRAVRRRYLRSEDRSRTCTRREPSRPRQARAPLARGDARPGRLARRGGLAEFAYDRGRGSQGRRLDPELALVYAWLTTCTPLAGELPFLGDRPACPGYGCPAPMCPGTTPPGLRRLAAPAERPSCLFCRLWALIIVVDPGFMVDLGYPCAPDPPRSPDPPR